MSSPRLRRLRLDYERLLSRFADWPAIRITSALGEPPEQYKITYHTRGLYSTPAGQILERQQHVVEINLSLGYPRRAPQCKMLTPIFHPNFDEVSVCIGDFWAASEGLDDLIVRIGRMIAYQEYNTKSPLNGLAARWAAQNAAMLPVDRRELAPPSEAAIVEALPKLIVQLDEAESAPLPPEPQYSDDALSEAELPEPQYSEPQYSEPHAEEPAEAEQLFEIPARLEFGSIGMALSKESVTVGRAPDNDIQLSHTSISGHHAVLLLTGEGVFLRDLGSTNGCTLNGAPVAGAWLQPEDKIGFGDIEALFIAAELWTT